MLFLIHGDQIVASRDKLTSLKKEFAGKEIRVINGKKFDLPQLIQALESSSLFGSDVCIVIEGFLGTAKKREKTFIQTLKVIIIASQNAEIILYEEKEIDKPTVAKLGAGVRVFLYKTPSVLFQFLDSLSPNGAQISLRLFGQAVAKEPAEIIYFLLTRRIRQLIQAKDGIVPDGMQSWQASRLTSQARHFTMEKLVAMHEKLLNMDIAVKSGASPFTLTQLTEQFIIEV